MGSSTVMAMNLQYDLRQLLNLVESHFSQMKYGNNDGHIYW